MRYLILVNEDGTVDLGTCPDNASLAVAGMTRVLEPTEEEWGKWRSKLATHDLKFDTVKKRVVAHKRKSEK